MRLTTRLAIDPAWAWQPYHPSPQAPWNIRRVGHLFRRAAFAATMTELEQARAEGPEKTVARLLAGGPDQDTFDRQIRQMADHLSQANNDEPMRAWWFYVLLRTPHPLREKMVLFWHNHFATSNAKVNNVAYMLAQNDLFRRHALGRFGPLLQEVSKDPAMMVWLDTTTARKDRPNENYARELMELFSLGIGNYTEHDIREAARAFTGWELRRGQPYFNRQQHDPNTKTVFGKTDRFTSEQIVDLCLEQPAATRFLARKLCRYFISETLEWTDELIAPVAELLRRTDFDIGQALLLILRSNLFFSTHAYRAKVKSPVSFLVGILRGLEARVGTVGVAQLAENLGQKLFYPPSVKGWDGGAAWLNATTLLLRQNAAQALTSTEDIRFGRRCDPWALVRRCQVPDDDQAQVNFFLKLFLDDEVPPQTRTELLNYVQQARHQNYPVHWTPEDREAYRLRMLCYLVLTQPEFQLE